MDVSAVNSIPILFEELLKSNKPDEFEYCITQLVSFLEQRYENSCDLIVYKIYDVFFEIYILTTPFNKNFLSSLDKSFYYIFNKEFKFNECRTSKNSLYNRFYNKLESFSPPITTRSKVSYAILSASLIPFNRYESGSALPVLNILLELIKLDNDQLCLIYYLSFEQDKDTIRDFIKKIYYVVQRFENNSWIRNPFIVVSDDNRVREGCSNYIYRDNNAIKLECFPNNTRPFILNLSDINTTKNYLDSLLRKINAVFDGISNGNLSSIDVRPENPELHYIRSSIPYSKIHDHFMNKIICLIAFMIYNMLDVN